MRRRYAMDGTLLSGPPETAAELAARQERFAEMIRQRKFPRIKTDATTFAGRHTLAEQVGNDIQLKRLVRAAQQHGYTPSYTDQYNPTLARFTGDPQAFYQTNGGAAHLKKLADQQGVALEGAIEYTPPRRDPAVRKTPLGKSLVERELRARVAVDPGLAQDKRRLSRAKEEIVTTHSFHRE